MQSIKIVVDEPPSIKPATRFGVINGHVRTWNSSSKHKELLQWKILSSLSKEQKDFLTANPDGEIRIKIRYFLPIPQSISEYQKNLMRWGITPHTCKPDYDNLTKFHNDVGNGILWCDDRQITMAVISKRYSDHPRTEYIIEVVNNMTLTKEMKQVLEIFSPTEVSSLIDDVWMMFEMYDTTAEVEATDNIDELTERLAKTACILSRIARNHASKLSRIAKKFPDLDIQHHKDSAKGPDEPGS